MKKFVFLFLLTILVVANPVYSSDEELVEQGKILREKAESGDADAMMALAELLITKAPQPKRPITICDGKVMNPLIRTNKQGANCETKVDEENQKLMKLWEPVGNKFMAAQWIDKAAEAGNRKAIAMKCAPKNDNLAPASMREEAELWCKRL